LKFIHAADIHLDTPLQGLVHYAGAPVNEIRNATRRAFEKLLDAALAHQVDFVIIAGDLYDVGLKSFESALFFNRQMTRLKEAGIDVYLIHGNHDAASKLIKQLRPPANVHVFRSNEPQTFRRDVLHLPVAIHGLSFATPEVTDDLAANYPAPVANAFNIGVLHTNISGISEHATTHLARWTHSGTRVTSTGRLGTCTIGKFSAAIHTSSFRETFRDAMAKSRAKRAASW
jgi:DNA repair protein SbcD/Mre11